MNSNSEKRERKRRMVFAHPCVGPGEDAIEKVRVCGVLGELVDCPQDSAVGAAGPAPTRDE